VSFAGLAALVVFILQRDRKLKRQLAALDRGKLREQSSVGDPN
jgi:hypothetical protein